MGTTATLKLPYPEPTDPVNQGAAAIKALADGVDLKYARLTTGPISGCTIPAGGGTLGFASGLTVAAQPFPQTVALYVSALASVLTTPGGQLIIRDAANAQIAIANFAAANSSIGALHVLKLAANTAATYNAIGTSTAAMTLSADARWAKWFALAFPSN